VSTSRTSDASHRTERSLFARLIDDAAVFPPGRAPLDRAVSDYQQRRRGPYADLIGPLLIPAAGAGQLNEIMADLPIRHPIPVTLIARPGTPMDQVEIALSILRGTGGIALTGLEVAHQADWTHALKHDLPLAVEVGKDAAGRRAALSSLVEAMDQAVDLRAKLRTQSVGEDPLPTAEELAGFVLGCVQRELPFKLTGGLHHAVAATAQRPGGGTEDQHGVLNVLLATHWALTGHELDDVAEVLLVRDPDTLVEALTALTDEEVGAVRSRFTSYGCCGVLDPIRELVDLGLISG
jgi:hypothetical protein